MFNSLNKAGLENRLNSGTISLRGLNNGTLVWVRVASLGSDGNGNGWGPIDDLIVNQNAGAPVFAMNPSDATLYASLPLTLSSLAVNGSSIHYHWCHVNNEGSTTNAVSGGTNNTLTITSPTPSDNGGYFAIASNALGTATSAVAKVEVLLRQSNLDVINGNFEDPAMGSDSTDAVLLSSWFSSAGNSPWPLGSGRVQVVPSQAAEFPPNSWMYQCLGGYSRSQGTNLNWSFTQVIPTDNNASAGFKIEFYAQNGAFAPSKGNDIAGNSAFSKLGSYSFNSLNAAGVQSRINNGTVNLGGQADGTVIWVKIANTGSDGIGNGWAPIDGMVFNENRGTPCFVTNPNNQNVDYSSPLTLTSLAVNGSAITYQWYHVATNGVTNAVAGGTKGTLAIGLSGVNDSGIYFAVANNALGAATSSVAQVQVLSRRLSSQNGDFESPAVGTNSTAFVLLSNWYSSPGINPWPLGSGRVIGGSQAAEFSPNSWIYQCLGAYSASLGTNLGWSFTQVLPTDNNGSAGFKIEFYAQAGSFTPSQGVDIAGNAALTQLGSFTFGSLNNAGLLSRLNSGTVGLSGLAEGTLVWIRMVNTGVGSTGNGWAPIDNLTISQAFGAPRIISNPSSQTNYSGCSLVLAVEVISSVAVQCQWYRIGLDGLTTNTVLNATNSVLTLAPAAPSESGDYFAVARNSFGTSTSAIANVSILTRSAALTVINGDFEQDHFANPNDETPGGGVKWWFSSLGGSRVWQCGAAKIQSNTPEYSPSQAACFEPGGWIYQCLGQYDPSKGTNLAWSFTQCSFTNGNASSGFDLRFYAQTGSFNPGAGLDVDGASGLIPLTKDPVGSFASLNRSRLASVANTGIVDLSQLSPNTSIWIRLSATGFDPFAGGSYSLYSNTALWDNASLFTSGGNAALDNVAVSQIFQTALTLNCGINANGEYQVEWANGTLMQATNITGPWIELPSVPSPFAVSPTNASQMFYRVKLQQN